VAAARVAREFALAPYSGFTVGAALLSQTGAIVTGCNVENASYGLTVCAERVALLKALSEGEREFAMLAIAADTEWGTPPCGSCRQLLWEYCGDIPIVLANLTAVIGRHQLKELFPLPFEPRTLGPTG
jgi:cytidine deaminase